MPHGSGMLSHLAIAVNAKTAMTQDAGHTREKRSHQNRPAAWPVHDQVSTNPESTKKNVTPT